MPAPALGDARWCDATISFGICDASAGHPGAHAGEVVALSGRNGARNFVSAYHPEAPRDEPSKPIENVVWEPMTRVSIIYVKRHNLRGIEWYSQQVCLD